MFSISIDRVAVPVGLGGLSEARQFYGEILGLKEVEVAEALAHNGGPWFELAGGQKLHLCTDFPSYPARNPHPAFVVEGFEELRQRILAHAGRVEDNNDIPGVRRFFSRDPFGNHLEFLDRRA